MTSEAASIVEGIMSDLGKHVVHYISNSTPNIALLSLYLVGHAVYVFTSKNASADMVAPLSFTRCLPVG